MDVTNLLIAVLGWLVATLTKPYTDSVIKRMRIRQGPHHLVPLRLAKAVAGDIIYGLCCLTSLARYCGQGAPPSWRAGAVLAIVTWSMLVLTLVMVGIGFHSTDAHKQALVAILSLAYFLFGILVREVQVQWVPPIGTSTRFSWAKRLFYLRH